MATFQAQVEALTGLGTLSSTTNPSLNELTQFLKDGVIDVTEKCIRTMPQEITDFQRVSSTIASNGGLDLGGARIISVLREATADGSSDGSTAWRSCRRIPQALESRVIDTDSLEFASIYNPVYMIQDNGKINVYPVPDGTDDGYKVYYVNNVPTDETNDAALTYAHADIKWFPNNKIYLVAIYAAIRSLEARVGATHSVGSEDWKFIKGAIESEEDIELGAARAQTLSGELAQYMQTMQSLRQEYIAAFMIQQPATQQPQRQRQGAR